MPKAGSSKWASVCQALKSLQKADYIQDIREQISYLRSEMVLRVLASLNEKMHASLDKQTQQLDAFNQKSREITNVLAINHTQTREAITRMRNGECKTYTYHGSGEVFDADSLLYLRSSVGSTEPQATFESGNEAKKTDTGIRCKILRHLHYRHISDRFSSISKAHKQTFEWVFCTPAASNRTWSDFPLWLQEGRGCYWIRGKAGSGKSTLMKYICQSNSTQKYLHEWAGSSSLTTASFFFWYLGYDIQKSQAGLLRSLLHDILSKNQWLMTHIMPELFIEAAKSDGSDLFEDLTLDELMWWFNKLGDCLSRNDSQKMCLFIDGLDEYSGNCAELIKLWYVHPHSLDIGV